MTRRTLQLETRDPAETEALAAVLAPLLQPGDVLALDGPLGAGKTCFTRGLVAGLADADRAHVASPTYALLNEYPTRPRVYHFDFYRLTDLDDLETTGYWDVVERADGIVVIEWWRRVADSIDESAIRVALEIQPAGRHLTFETPETRAEILEVLSGASG